MLKYVDCVALVMWIKYVCFLLHLGLRHQILVLIRGVTLHVGAWSVSKHEVTQGSQFKEIKLADISASLGPLLKGN